MIIVVNKRWFGQGGHYIGRPSPLGNKFTHLNKSTLAEIKVGSRVEAVEKYKEWLLEELKTETPAKIEFNRLLKELEYNGYLFLVCWCKPALCHGDVIAELLEKQCPIFHPSKQLLDKVEGSEDYLPKEFHFVHRFLMQIGTFGYTNQAEEPKLLKISDGNTFIPEICNKISMLKDGFDLLHTEFSTFINNYGFSGNWGKSKIDNGIILELNALPKRMEKNE